MDKSIGTMNFIDFIKVTVQHPFVFLQACLGGQPWMVSAEASRAEKKRKKFLLIPKNSRKEEKHIYFFLFKIRQVRTKLLKSPITQTDKGKGVGFFILSQGKKTGGEKKHLF